MCHGILIIILIHLFLIQSSEMTVAQRFESDLTSKIYSTMEKHKEVFFVIRLCSQTAALSLPPIQDPDALVNCDLMDGRDAFLTLAREKHYEFSSLRRAKFSSMALLFELHNSTFFDPNLFLMYLSMIHLYEELMDTLNHCLIQFIQLNNCHSSCLYHHFLCRN